MYYSTIREIDTANGIGVGVSIFVSGCRNHCKGCFQPETWNFEFGSEFTDDKLAEIISFVQREYIDFFSILGGDPMEPENKEEVAHIISEVLKAKPDIKIFIWSGYLYEELIKDEFIKKNILDKCDYLIDGKFVMEKRNIKLKLRGSSNQRILDAKTGKNLTDEFESRKD